jgi:D-serine deaminase-like pyridoxal phosphate-dependent protein
VDEIRPGNFIFFDAEQFCFGSCQFKDVAVALACPVVALHPERETVIVYGGAIHLSKDTWKENNVSSYGLVALPNEQGWGDLIPGAYVYSLSQEHGLVHIPASAMAQIQIGDLLCILPAHSCLTIQAMQKYLTLDGRWVDTLLT